MEVIRRKRKLAAMLIITEIINDDRDEEIILRELAESRKEVSAVFQKRMNLGIYNTLIKRHLRDEEEKFQSYFRLTRERFSFVLSLVEEDITSSSYNRVKEPITAAEKLALTLRFLATGESYRSLSFGYRISHSAISKIVPKVLAALQTKLVPLFLPPPEEIRWAQKADEFWKRWSFPNCIASIDGKHVRIVAPAKSGSLYFNYKGYYSVVVLAMVDANCKFLIIDVGSYGKEGDAGIFKKSKMGELVKNGTMFPPPKYLPNSHTLLPHVVVGDDAFSLSEHMMKPYPRAQILHDEKKRKFNFCLSKARRTSENAFGIMSTIFRIFLLQ
ncbi:unnamed protein product [Acanthoscelides obtectus]|uniref:DDE Tnp4 domain-containing protein n=1 Tax=Acanthoscelides obtectus TaxID=200917 RepID=A0A9P0JS77_ACAOB|nr:unnamed protein product [Acanthoscelides obtectus]CAK1679445.1 Protein ALP1-like [Acanthoscelides obtectus]